MRIVFAGLPPFPEKILRKTFLESARRNGAETLLFRIPAPAAASAPNRFTLELFRPFMSEAAAEGFDLILKPDLRNVPPWDPEGRGFLKFLASEFRPFDFVHGWIPPSETPPEGAFADWLEQRFRGKIKDLNAAWGRVYFSFGDIPSVTPDAFSNTPETIAFQRFLSEFEEESFHRAELLFDGKPLFRESDFLSASGMSSGEALFRSAVSGKHLLFEQLPEQPVPPEIPFVPDQESTLLSFLPDLPTIPAADAEKILETVRNGAILFLGPRSGTRSAETGAELPPDRTLLAETTGATAEAPCPGPESLHIRIGKNPLDLRISGPIHPLNPVRRFTENLSPLPDGRSLLLRIPIGTGFLYAAGFTPEKKSLSILRHALEAAAGIPVGIVPDSEGAPVEAVAGTANGRRAYLLYFPKSGHAVFRRGNSRAGKFALRNAETGKTLKFQNGVLKFKVSAPGPVLLVEHD